MLKHALAIVLICSAAATSAESQDNRNEELDLPYAAPGRGEVDHDALRRRSLAVLENQFGRFETATADLQQAAIAHCDQGASEAELKAAFKQAWLTWAPLDSYQFGPIEENAAALTVNFWPDKKNFVGRALRGLLAEPPDAQRDVATIAAGSAGIQGLPALEMLLYTEAPACPAVIGISGYLHQTAEQLYGDWFDPDGWADLARQAGPDNPVYLSAEEFTKTLYTALDFGLIRVGDQRLGRPLGSYERSFPKRAEAWRSGLTADIIRAQLQGIGEMVEWGFAGDVRDPDRAWILRVLGQAEARIDKIGVPIDQAVTDPAIRIRVEGLKSKIDLIRTSFAQDLGPNLGVDTGFSPADGD